MTQAYLTLARIAGDPHELVDGYLRTAARMADVGRDHGLLAHVAAPADGGLLIVNLWRSRAGSTAAGDDPRRARVVEEHGLAPGQIRYEHHLVAGYELFG